LGLIGSAVLTFIGYKQTSKQIRKVYIKLVSGLIPLNILTFQLFKKKVLQITIISGHTLNVVLDLDLDENLVLTTFWALEQKL